MRSKLPANKRWDVDTTDMQDDGPRDSPKPHVHMNHTVHQVI